MDDISRPSLADMLDSSSPREQPEVELDEIREVIRMYTRALSGINTQVTTSDEMYNKGLGWVSLEAQELGGGAVLLPDMIEDWPSQEENFRVYKVLATHQAAHLEAATLRFSLEQSSRLFDDLRPRLLELLPSDEPSIVDFRRFFALFTHRKLAMDIFNILEDFRVDSRLHREYRGIFSVYEWVQTGMVKSRPQRELLPLREAAVESLFRYGVNVGTQFSLPKAYLQHIIHSIGLLNLLSTQEAAVEDSAEATIRAYCSLRRVPNFPSRQYSSKDYVQVDFGEVRYNLNTDDPAFWLTEFQEVNAGARRRRRGDPIGGAGEVVYKGIPSSEFQEHLSFDLRDVLGSGELNLDDLDQPLPGESQWGTEEDGDFPEEFEQIELATAVLEHQQRVNGHASDLDAEVESLIADKPDEEEVVPGSAMDRGMCEGEPEAFIYPEWDHREESYRADWCTLWQRRLKGGSTDFFNDTLRRYHYLVSLVEKRFEMLRPELFVRRRGLEDGDELDLDRLVDSHAGMKAAGYVDEKIYQRRDKNERSVSLLFLLDMSISTSESIDTSRRQLATSGLGGYDNPEHKKIIDVEKESLVVLTRALEKVGDRYGIYGFSGRGREGTRFYVIKDITKPLDEEVMARMGTIAPVQATRMGPAIRHAIDILKRDPSKTKILVLISDGQPQDLDYGAESEGGRAPATRQHVAEEREKEKAYAVSDTHKALSEARSSGIVPFMLSIDRHGYDYLRIMCGEFGYEVVSDVQVLPRRLVSLYQLLAG